MLVIGHRGAAGSAPENTLEALRHGYTVGADILEFDIQLTRDKIPIVIHDSTLLRTHGKRSFVRLSKHSSIRQAAEKGHYIATLEDVLDEFFGKTILNLELKHQGVARVVLPVIEKYINRPEDWDAILFSSFKTSELYRLRRAQPLANLALLQHRNPFLFIAHHRKLNLTAVGFHRLYLNMLSLQIAKKAKIFTYVYTVNRQNALKKLDELGIGGVVTDHPEELTKYLASH